MNLHDLFEIPRRRAPEGWAVIATGGTAGAGAEGSTPGDRGKRWSYGELLAAAEGLAARWREEGLRRGDRVALYLGNGPRTVVVDLALLRLGAVAVPMNLAYRRPEIAHVLADAEPRLVVTGAEHRETVAGVPAARRRSVERILLVSELGIDGLRADSDPGGSAHGSAAAGPPVDGSELALLLYTSGTTGASKGAMLSHDNLSATITGLLAAWGWHRDDRLLLTLPLFHTHGLVVGLFTALAAGATVLLERRFDAAAVADRLLAADDPLAPTLFFGVPTMYVRLVAELRRRRDAGADVRLPHLRLFASGSAPLPPETFAAFRDLTGHEILERYGMTETGMNLSNPYAGGRLPGTVGRPLPGVSARLVDGEGRAVEDGGEGELLVAGSNVFAGYWRDAEKTAASFVAGGEGAAGAGRRWFRTGDLARRDAASGHFTLLGRRHELILTGGFNVYPREVEEALEEIPGVREAAVAGLPDADRGEVVAAWLVLGEGAPEDLKAGDPEELAARLRERLADRLAGFKLPRRAFRLDELPRNALGKVQKHRLPDRGA